jgi:putative heme-binding domain-containing protein
MSAVVLLVRPLFLLLCIACCCFDLEGRAAASSPQEYRRFAMLHEGDVAAGKALFLDTKKLACSTCHSIDGTVAKAGPDLFAAGDGFTRTDLIEAVLYPSKNIANGYSTTLIETKSGDGYSGILKNADDRLVEIIGADGQRQRIARSEITRQTVSETSLMPEGLQNGLSLQEFADVIEFLVSLKQPLNARMLAAGMPAAIEELARPVELVPFISEDVKFAHPVWFGRVTGESNVFFVVEHESGEIWRLQKGPDHDAKTLFVTLGRVQKGTRGLLGMVLHPRFAENGRYFVARHTVENGSYSTLILERQAAADRKTDSGKESRLILKIDETSNVHYGGGLQFGPDGFLYIGMGDSGPQEDPNGNAQNTRSFLGKMMRIDVDHQEPGRSYRIPVDNPFVGRADFRPEIWAYGFREPWRFSFDPLTGDLWVGDVGQDRYEEVDLVRRGENYGWNVYEGFEPFSNRYRRDAERYVPPVFAYARKLGVSVTGGFVYRTDPQSSFYGVYIFADYQSRRIWGLTQENRALKRIEQIALCPDRVVSFGRDERGELYVVGYDEGMIYKMDFSRSRYRAP